MADSKLTLAGDFEAGKTYMLRGETLLQWRRALMADRAIPGPGLSESGTPGGRILSAAFPDTLPQFSPYRWEPLGGADWKCLITPGFVAERRAADAVPPVLWHDPELGGVALTATPAPELEISDGQYCFARVKTEKNGAVKDKVTIVAGADTDGVFHLPQGVDPDGGAGVEGDYYVRLFQLVVVDGKPTIVRYQADDIEWMPWLWSGAVIGAANGRIYKRYNPETRKHEFRSVESPNAGFLGLGNPITTADAVEVRGNNVWQDIRYQECPLGAESEPTLKGILAIRDGLSSWHVSEGTVPEVPDGVTKGEISMTYANCHCCGEGP